jgi:predicted signal transduction protein with EAL and GGDEF domain
VGASIGVAVAEPGLSISDIIRHADVAMYAAKARGKNRVERFVPDHREAIAERWQRENGLVRSSPRR